MRLLFNPDQHKYYFVEDPSIELTSVSKLIGYYHEEFDEDKMSKRIADKRGTTQQEVLEEWRIKREKSQLRGSLYHQRKEQELLDRPNVFKHLEFDGVKQAFDITELKPGVYPELILYHPYYNIVGTADVVTIYEDKTFDLEDHKTSEKLEFTGFPVFNKSTMKREPKKMFNPISHVYDCNGTHYTLQLSSYAFILEEAEYECKNLILHHVLFDEEEKDIMIVDYPINYLKKEVKNMFEHFKNNRNET